ncbi:MAG: nucleotidyltransferase family protein [Clostridia bacterium]|nr:nucleotidyltransferase family protein [Clostridia bacterium]
MKTGCILMAAGVSSRFGENKLLLAYQGKPVYACAMNAIPAERLCAVAVVSGTDEVLQEAAARGFTAILNERPQDGVSRTIRLGLDALGGVDAALFLVGDQPALTRASVLRLLDMGQAHPSCIVRLGYGDTVGNPVWFPGKYFDELRALTGDTGGGRVLRTHPEAVRTCQADHPCELWDIDSPEALQRLNEALS